jgi:orotidine-5'-phosphate decarboxylase
MESPIIVALDGLSPDKTVELAEILDGWVWAVKLEDIIWEAPGVVPEIANPPDDVEGRRVILDAKLHHTPHQMKNICRRLAENEVPVEFVSVHATAGPESIEAAASELPGKLCASLVLTSINETDSMHIYGYDHVQVSMRLASIAVNAGCTAVVCGSHEIAHMPKRGEFGSHIKKIVAGIRPEWYAKKGDVKRSCTPRRAIDMGADLIIMGRPIVEHPEPVAAIQQTLKEIEKG